MREQFAQVNHACINHTYHACSSFLSHVARQGPQRGASSFISLRCQLRPVFKYCSDVPRLLHLGICPIYRRRTDVTDFLIDVTDFLSLHRSVLALRAPYGTLCSAAASRWTLPSFIGVGFSPIPEPKRVCG